MAPRGNGRVVVISGANGGIGSELSSALVANDYRVAGLDIDDSALAALRKSSPDRVRSYACDVTDPESVSEAIDDVIDEWDQIDILVNAAAIATYEPFDERTEETLRREFEVNYFGALRTIRAVLPHMRENEAGIVHNVSSGTAFGGHAGMTGYASTKGAIEAFTRSLRQELRGENVWCTLMQPPMTDTALTADIGYPDWALYDPAEVGRKLAGKIESTGPVVYADWQTRFGLTVIRHVPSVWEWAVGRFGH